MILIGIEWCNDITYVLIGNNGFSARSDRHKRDQLGPAHHTEAPHATDVPRRVQYIR